MLPLIVYYFIIYLMRNKDLHNLILITTKNRVISLSEKKKGHVQNPNRTSLE